MPRDCHRGLLALGIAALILTIHQPRIPAQASASPDRRATERFRGREVVAGEVLIGLRQLSDRGRLRIETDAASDAPLGAGRIWQVRSRSRSGSGRIS